MLFIFSNSFSQQLLYTDDFNDSVLNTTFWRTTPPWGRIYTLQDREVYGVDSNIKINDGVLQLHMNYLPDTYDVSYSGKPDKIFLEYTSASIFSKNKFTYGTFEMRCKFPPNCKPAFWLYGENCEEIDVFELLTMCNSSKVTFTVHECDAKKKKNRQKSKNYTTTDFTVDWHTYTLIWTAEKIIWLIDSKPVYVCTKTGKNACIKYGVNKTLFPETALSVIITLSATNRGTACRPSTKTIMLIDYINIWQGVPDAYHLFLGQ